MGGVVEAAADGGVPALVTCDACLVAVSPADGGVECVRTVGEAPGHGGGLGDRVVVCTAANRGPSGGGRVAVSVLWVGMLGAMAATRDDRQISVDVLSRFLPERWKIRVRVITDTFTAAVTAFLAWHAARLVLIDHADGMMAFASVPVWLCELVLPVAAAVISVRYGMYAIHHLRQALHSGSES